MPKATIEALLRTFAAAEGCWFASVRPDGRAHVVPSWFVWHEGSVWFSSSGYSVHGRNVHSNRHVSLHLPDVNEALIVEGIATVIEQGDRATAELLAPYFKSKYNLDMLAEMEKGPSIFIRVEPVKVLAWGRAGNARWLWRDGVWVQDKAFNPFG